MLAPRCAAFQPHTHTDTRKKMKEPSCKRLDQKEKETFLLPIRFSSKRALPFAMECSVQPETAVACSSYYYCEVHFSKEKNNGALQLHTSYYYSLCISSVYLER